MPNEICEYCNVESCCYAVNQGVTEGIIESTAFDDRLECNYTAHGYNFSRVDIEWCADPYICGPCYGDAKFSVRSFMLHICVHTCARTLKEYVCCSVQLC